MNITDPKLASIIKSRVLFVNIQNFIYEYV